MSRGLGDVYKRQITDLTMTPKANDTSSDSSDTNSDSKDTSSNNSGTSTNSKNTDSSATDSKTPAKNNAGSTNPNTGNNVSGILLTFVIAGSGLVVAGRKSRKNK